MAIVINHLQWYPNGFDWVAMRGSLFVSAAEGFFLLSGIVLGIVRGRKLIEKPFRIAASLLLKRGVLLYVTSVLLTSLFMVIGWWFFMDNVGLKPGIRPIDEPLGDVIMGILSLEYLYGWADFLQLYAVFLIASPIALWLLRKNLWYVLIGSSIVIWSLFPFAHEHSPRSAELLMMLSWQLIFFIGLTIGFYWDMLQAKWQQLAKKTQLRILVPVLSIAAITLLANIILEVFQLEGWLPHDINAWYTSLAPYFFKQGLPLPLLILFGLWFLLGFFLFKRFEKYIVHYLGWLLLPFGQNSLYVYILHAILLFFAHLIMPADSTNILLNVTGTLVILSIIYTAVKHKFLFKIIPR